MPNTAYFGADTPQAHVSGSVVDKDVVIPQTPAGLRADGPRVTFNFTGEWNADNSYVYYDVVKDNSGASWIAKYPIVPKGASLEEGTYWTRWADPNIEVEELYKEVQRYAGEINISVKKFANVSEMSDYSNSKKGDLYATAGFYSANDGGGGFYVVASNVEANSLDMLAIKNNLTAILITDGYINAKQLGISESKNASDVINRACAIAKNVYIPAGNYTCEKTISVNINNSGLVIEGAGKFSTILKNTAIGGNKLFISTGSNITLKNLGFVNNAEIESPIELRNGNTRELINCLFSCPKGLAKPNISVYINNDASYTGPTFLTKIENCRFDKISVTVYSTDSYFVNNEFWGNERTAAFISGNCSNSIFDGNEFVSGTKYGCLVFATIKQEGVRIISNYFDGSYSNVPNTPAIQNTSAYITNDFIIAGNTFWKLKNTGISMATNNTIISGNSFNECDVNDIGVSDVEIDGNNSYSLSINNNSFHRASRDNKSKPINVSGTPISPIVVNGNICSFTSAYIPCDLPSNTVTVGNSSQTFFNAI